MRILIDMDEVLADTLGYAIEMCNNEHGTNVRAKDLVEWDIAKCVPEGQCIVDYFYEEGFFRDLPLVEGAQKYMYKLHKDGHELLVVTASPPNGVPDKAEWLEEHFPWFDMSNFVPAIRKDIIYGDIMFDDGVHNLETANVQYPILMDAPHNKHDMRFERVSSWKAFYECVRRISTDG